MLNENKTYAPLYISVIALYLCDLNQITMTKYIAYYRVSTREQGDSRLGLQAQESDCRQFVVRVGGELIDSFKEVESGNNNSRIELSKAITAAKKQGARLLIAKLDRLSRNVQFIFALRDSKVDFVCCDMPDANTVTIGIMAVMAQHEREIISQRTKAALAVLKSQGVKLGNPNIKEVGKYARAKRLESLKANTNKPNDAAIGIILDKRAKGMTYKEIANDLNELNLRTTYGKAFAEDNVRILFTSTLAKIKPKEAQ